MNPDQASSADIQHLSKLREIEETPYSDDLLIEVLKAQEMEEEIIQSYLEDIKEDEVDFPPEIRQRRGYKPLAPGERFVHRALKIHLFHQYVWQSYLKPAAWFDWSTDAERFYGLHCYLTEYYPPELVLEWVSEDGRIAVSDFYQPNIREYGKCRPIDEYRVETLRDIYSGMRIDERSKNYKYFISLGHLGQMGLKVMEGGRKGRLVLGDSDSHKARTESIMAKCIELANLHPRWNTTKVRAEAAKQLGLSIPTINRHTRGLVSEVKKKLSAPPADKGM